MQHVRPSVFTACNHLRMYLARLRQGVASTLQHHTHHIIRTINSRPCAFGVRSHARSAWYQQGTLMFSIWYSMYKKARKERAKTKFSPTSLGWFREKQHESRGRSFKHPLRRGNRGTVTRPPRGDLRRNRPHGYLQRCAPARRTKNRTPDKRRFPPTFNIHGKQRVLRIRAGFSTLHPYRKQACYVILRSTWYLI